jgi:hypothetical protein
MLSCRDLDLESHQSVAMLKSERSLQIPFLACWANSPLLGYLSPSCNCLWAFLTLLGTVLGIQFSRFSLGSAHFSFPATASLGFEENSPEFSPSSKMQALRLSAKVNNGAE